ncbi:hypothetical protein LCGC14_1285660 [marine sediment metagenome]|uniref:Uncharacterized protein n=1 Tax=marine sediment metagenome TaxID=412755 RepID=A0A0F9KVM2_9ZZZZ
MATPTPKSPEIESLLEGFSGRTSAIEANRCVDEPIGCGKPVMDFKDDPSEDEYRTSGLCQICQDEVFGN